MVVTAAICYITTYNHHPIVTHRYVSLYPLQMYLPDYILGHFGS